MGLEILRFSVPELVEGQNDKLNDTLSISAVVVLKSSLFYLSFARSLNLARQFSHPLKSEV